MRAGAIQAFEFTYELSVRMIKRYLEQVSANPAEVDGLDFRTLIRRAREQGLLHSELDVWMGYRANRGITSHTYNENSAERVFQGIPEFSDEPFLWRSTARLNASCSLSVVIVIPCDSVCRREFNFTRLLNWS